MSKASPPEPRRRARKPARTDPQGGSERAGPPNDRRGLGILFLGLLGAAIVVTLIASTCGRRGESPASPEGQEASSAATGTPSGPVATVTPTAPSVERPSGPIRLASGVTLTPPAGGTPINAPGGIPAEVSRSNQAFRLPGGNRRIMVSEIALGGEKCSARLDQEWARMERSKSTPDAGTTEMRRVTTTEERQVGGRRVLWAESMQGTSLVDAGAPFAATATALTCAGESLVLVMYMATEPALDASVRPTIEAMLASLRLPERP